MMRIIGALVLAAVGLMQVAVAAERGPEEEMVVQLSGAAALCSIKGQGIWLESKPSDSVEKIQRQLAQAKQCADNGRAEGKTHYQAALRQVPASRPLLTPVYAAWLNYMSALESPLDRAKASAARDEYESAVNALSAELDARL